MSHTEIDQLGVPQEALLKVFSLNTGHSGRQLFTELAPGQSPTWRFDRILDFIHQEARVSPNLVISLQEVYKPDLERYANALGGQVVFSPLCRLSLTGRLKDAEGWGIAIGSRLPILESRDDYYKGSRDSIEVNLDNSPASRRSLLQAQVEVGSARFNVATTHFTWHNRPEPNDEQLRDFANFADLLNNASDIVLTGDFNSPRGYPIFNSLAERYRDNVPADVVTTFDTSVRPEATWGVVDGFFTSRHYRAKVRLAEKGLSDHRGLMGKVSRVA